jgi:hypothetical protein
VVAELKVKERYAGSNFLWVNLNLQETLRGRKAFHGSFGAFPDEKPAEEIIEEIRASRKFNAGLMPR